jgi:hypothetical protein
MALTLDGTTGISATGNIVGNNISVSGTLTAGTFSPASVSASGNVNGGNILSAGIVSATGNIVGNFILGNGSQLTGVDATQIVNGTSNARVVSSGGNIAVGIGGTPNVAVFATTGAFVTGVMSASGNLIGSNVLTAGFISATSTITSAANVVGGNITTAGIVTATGNIQAGNLRTAGLITATGNIDAGNIRTVGLVSATGGITGAAITGTSLSVSGNVDGGNLRTAGLISATGGITGAAISGTSLSVSGNVDGGNLRTAGLISATGAITGAAISGTSLTVSTGNVSCGNIVNTNGNGVGNIGSSSLYFNTVFAKATSAQYADLAEMYSAGASYEPGTVLVFDGAYEVEISTTSHANNVAGVVSTNPSYIMNAGQQGPHVVAVALQGRVPTRVVGTVRKGDRMVSSHIPGVAQALDSTRYEPGCIIGKALVAYDPVFDQDGNEIPGTIEIVVGRV